MARYQAGEIHFNLMAIVQDKLVRYKEQMQASVGKLLGTQSSELLILSHVFLAQDDATRHEDLKLRIIDEEHRRKNWRKVIAILIVLLFSSEIFVKMR